MKKLSVCVLSVMMLLALIGCSNEETVVEEPVSLAITIKEINKRGNLILDTPASTLSETFRPGDIVDIVFNENTVTVPVGTSYSDVNNGNAILRLDSEDDEAVIAINYGNFAETYGVDETVTEIVIVMNEKEGYLVEYNARNLERSTVREDYPDLSDEEYANFRAVRAGDIKEGILYRSSSPVDEELGRNTYVDELLREYGIQTAVNVDNEEEEMAEFEGYADSYYSSCTVLYDVLSYEYASDETKAEIAEIIRFMLNNEGPYLIHCKEGKDRTGYLLMLIEAFMNGDIDEISEDYLKTYVNFYGLKESDDMYKRIKEDIFYKIIETMFEIESVENVDLAACANEYLLNSGLTEKELDSFRKLLGE